MSEVLYNCGDRQSRTSLRGARGARRRRIVALLQEHPEGLRPAEMRTGLGVDQSVADTCLGLRRSGLLQRVGRGTEVAAGAGRHDHACRSALWTSDSNWPKVSGHLLPLF